VRKRIEEVFGWMRTIGGLRKLHHRGGARVNWQFLFRRGRLQSDPHADVAGPHDPGASIGTTVADRAR
jgi:hypothetical protein